MVNGSRFKSKIEITLRTHLVAQFEMEPEFKSGSGHFQKTLKKVDLVLLIGRNCRQ